MNSAFALWVLLLIIRSVVLALQCNINFIFVSRLVRFHSRLTQIFGKWAWLVETYRARKQNLINHRHLEQFVHSVIEFIFFNYLTDDLIPKICMTWRRKHAKWESTTNFVFTGHSCGIPILILFLGILGN